MVRSPATIAWQATFEPFKKELPKSAARWFEFGHVHDYPEAGDLARRWARAVRQDGKLVALWPEQFVRDTFVGGTHLDLAMAALLGTALSVGRAHAPVVSARLRSGDAKPVLGGRVLRLFVPVGFT